METSKLRGDARHLQGTRRFMNWRTTSAILLLVLDIVVKTDAGRPQSFLQRVVGGQNAEPREWPWQACLTYNNNPVCGGSLISKNWVATAAHCVANRNFRNFFVLLGMLNLNDTVHLRVRVSRVIIHPLFRGEGSSGDLVLMKLAEPVIFDDFIRPIYLPSQNQEFQNGKMCWLTGWGRTTVNDKLPHPYTLQKVPLPLMDHSECDKMYQAAYNLTYPPEFVKSDMICAGYPEGKKDGCQGDSGGPLACQSGGSWVLVGIVSWGDGCAEPLKPGVYTQVFSFLDWIKENTDYSPVSELKASGTTQMTQMTEGTSPAFTSSKVINQGSASTTSTPPKVMDQGLASTTSTPPKVMDQGLASPFSPLFKVTDKTPHSAGRRLQVSMSLLVVVVLSRVLDIV